MSDADRIIDLYQRNAQAWVRNRGHQRGRRPFEAAWLDQFRALIPERASILDLGCGSAEPISRYFIEHHYRMTGVDSSDPLIEICRAQFPEHHWILADMRQLALKQQFSGILAWDSFFHLCPDDQRRMFPIFREHAAPKAALLFTSGPLYGEILGSFEGEPLYHASLDPDEYRSLLSQNGFEVVSHVVEDPNCGTHTIWLAQLI
jgi:SAM-dependent methyltransferase